MIADGIRKNQGLFIKRFVNSKKPDGYLEKYSTFPYLFLYGMPDKKSILKSETQLLQREHQPKMVYLSHNKYDILSFL